MMQIFLKEIHELNLLDIGCSGSLDLKWKPIEKYLNVIGFDLNKDECERLSKLSHNFCSVKYLPYAISGDNSISTLYKTQSAHCYSLLKPRTDWLRRFSFGDLFELNGTETIQTKTLDTVKEIDQLDIDIIKLDTQGLELPILSRAEKIFKKAFYVETETGFSENYIGETTYAQIDTFMRDNNFLLFDININHRVSRNNVYKNDSCNEQILWCEATWLKDHVALRNQGKLGDTLSRRDVLKALILCSLHGCISYGFELAKLYNELNFINDAELRELSCRENWSLIVLGNGYPEKRIADKFINYISRWLSKIKSN